MDLRAVYLSTTRLNFERKNSAGNLLPHHVIYKLLCVEIFYFILIAHQVSTGWNVCFHICIVLRFEVLKIAFLNLKISRSVNYF